MRPFEVRARLDQAFGGHGNQSIWSGGPLPASAIDTAEDWLNQYDTLHAQNPNASRADLIVQAKPLLAGDQCRLGPAPGVPVACDEGIAAPQGPAPAGRWAAGREHHQVPAQAGRARRLPGRRHGGASSTRSTRSSRRRLRLDQGAGRLERPQHHLADLRRRPSSRRRRLRCRTRSRDRCFPAYARPKAATPVNVALVPAFEQCSSGNATHGAPLAVPVLQAARSRPPTT